MISSIAPEVTIIDVTHGIEPFNVLQGAVTLANALPYLPAGVHLAVVDPGVGSDRRAVALRDAAGQLFVGPDNGLLLLAAEQAGRVSAAVELQAADPVAERGSATFHARDVFAPAAARLAQGTELSELGAQVEPDSLLRLQVPEPVHIHGQLEVCVLSVDRFGNVALGARVETITEMLPGQSELVLESTSGSIEASIGRTFASVAPGCGVVYVNAFGQAELGVREGSAAAALDVASGDAIRVRAKA